MLFLEWLFILLCIGAISAAPAMKSVVKESNIPESKKNESTFENADNSAFYNEYLKDVLKVLSGNSDFRKKIGNISIDDIKSGKITNDMNFFPEQLREKLNLLKQQEFHRLRKMLEAKSDLENGREVKKSHLLKEMASHLDHDNPHTFEVKDLTNLIKAATKDIKDFDLERHNDFKKHVMEKEIRREERLKKLSKLDRMKEEEKYLKHQQEFVASIPKVNPGSKEQLEQVWKEEDHLDGQPFNPKTFFKLHDLNNDGMWDSMEIEALLEKELQTLYNTSAADYDEMTMEEERRHMREYVTKNIDRDKNNLVSEDEFLRYTQSSDFRNPNKNNLYKNVQELLQEHSVYTAEELQNYRTNIKMQEEEIIEKLGKLRNGSKVLSRLKMEFKDIRRRSGEDEDEEQDKALADKAYEIKKAKRVLKDLQEDLEAHSRDLERMKETAKKHEDGEKETKKIQDKLESMPPGEEKMKAVKKAYVKITQLRETAINDKNDKKEEHHDEKNDHHDEKDDHHDEKNEHHDEKDDHHDEIDGYRNEKVKYDGRKDVSQYENNDFRNEKNKYDGRKDERQYEKDGYRNEKNKYDSRKDERQYERDGYRNEKNVYDSRKDERQYEKDGYRNEKNKYDSRKDERQYERDGYRNEKNVYDSRKDERQYEKDGYRNEKNKYDSRKDERQYERDGYRNEKNVYDSRKDERQYEKDGYRNEKNKYDSRKDERQYEKERYGGRNNDGQYKSDGYRNEKNNYDSRKDERQYEKDGYRNEKNKFDGRKDELNENAISDFSNKIESRLKQKNVDKEQNRL